MLHHVLQKLVKAGIFVVLIGAFGEVGAVQDGTGTAAAAPAGPTSASAASIPIASTLTTPSVKMREQHERLTGSFRQDMVGKSADSPGWNAWLSVYGPPPREQDTDEDPAASTLTGETYDNRPQDCTLWTTKGCNVPGRRFAWHKYAEVLDSAGQPVVRKGGTLFGVLSANGSTATGTQSDGGRSQPLTLKRVARYHELTGAFGQAELTERYPVMGGIVVGTLIQSLCVRRCDQYDTECVVRISAVGLGDTVNLLRIVWVYSGDTHGNYSSTAGNQRCTSQEFQSTTLAEVLRPTPIYLQSFSAQIIDTLKRGGAPDAPRGTLKECDLRNTTFPFTLQSDRIVIHYGPYEIGPYSSGAFHAAVRSDDLGTAYRRPIT